MRPRLMIGIEYLDDHGGADVFALKRYLHSVFGQPAAGKPLHAPITITREEIERVIVITGVVATMKVFLPLTEPLAKIPGTAAAE